MTSYTYSIQNDTLNHKISSDTLSKEIQLSQIAVALDHIDTAADALIIYFKSDLSSGDQTLLTSIVNNHKGNVTNDVPLVLYKVSDNLVSGFIGPWVVAPPAGFMYKVVRTHLVVDENLDLNSASANFSVINAGDGTISTSRAYSKIQDYLTRAQEYHNIKGHDIYQWNYVPNAQIDSSIPLRSSVSGQIQLSFTSGTIWTGGTYASLTVEVLSLHE